MPEERRVRYVSDEEAAHPKRELGELPALSRQGSASSLRSGGVRRRSVDPALALPIEYRTLSIHIDDTRERQVDAEAQALKAKSKTAAGWSCHITPCAEADLVQNWPILTGTQSPI